MKRCIHLVIAVIAIGSASLAAEAAASGGGDESGWFVGGAVGSMPYEEDGYSQAVGVTFIQFGKQFSRFFSMDARLGFGGSSSLIEIEFDDLVDVKMKSMVGIYARGALPVASRWDVFAEAGLASVKIKVNTFGESASKSSQSFSYGLGISWKPAPAFAVDLEYLPTVVQGEGWSASMLSLGGRWVF